MRRIFFFLFIIACGESDPSRISDVEAHHLFSKAIIGSGYDDLIGKWRYRCLEGNTQELSTQSATVLMEVKASSVANSNSIDFQTSLEIAKGLGSLSPSISYLTSSLEDQFSLIHSFEASYIFSHKIFEPNLKLTPIGAEAKTNWRKLCGGEFVSQVVKGARLRFSLRFDFESEDVRKKFEAQVRLADYINELGVDLSFSEELSTKDWLVSIFAEQIGGEVNLLSTALPLGVNLLRCDSTELEPCIAVFTELLDYARNPQRFPSQIAHNGATGAVDIRYLTESYEAIVEGFDSRDQKAIKAYKEAVKKYTLLNLSYRNRMESIKQLSASSNYKRFDLVGLKAIIEENERVLRETIIECSALIGEHSDCHQVLLDLSENFKTIPASQLSLYKLNTIPCAPGYYLERGYCRELEATR